MVVRCLAWCLKVFSKRWRYVRYFFQVLTIVRFGLLTVAIIGGAVLLSQQVGDILRALVEDAGTSWAADVRVLSLFFAAFLCGLMVWYGARTMLRFRFMGKPGSAARVLPRLKRQLPRVLGASVPLILAIKVWTLAPTSEQPMRMRLFGLALLAEAAVLFTFVLFRRDLAKRLQLPWLGVPYAQMVQNLRNVRGAGSTVLHTYRALLVLNVIFMVLFTLAPGTGRTIGSMAILMIALTLVNATGSVIVYVGNRYRIPALSLLLCWALLSSFTADNHEVRSEPPSVKGNITAAAQSVPDLETYFLDWLAQRPEQDAPDRAIPVFLVSAEGGGIRAAYWTAAVLGELEDEARRECLPFARQVFAISGVSGGSLGAAAFAAALHSNPLPRQTNPMAPQNGPGVPAGSPPAAVSRCAGSPLLRPITARMLSEDFLSPTVAAALFPDMFQRFVPVPLFHDRAAALEHAWEYAWSNSDRADPGEFAKPFAALWSRGDYSIPLLFLNGVVVETGQRALVHPLAHLAKQGEGTFAPVRGPFTDALHISDVLPNGLPLSTAVHLSARFTYVSPAGRIDLPEQDRRLRLVDGGYFDNSGAVTTQEIFAAIQHAISHSPEGSPARRVWPIVLHISNEPASDPPRPAPSGVLERHPFAPEILSPIRAIFATRSARGFQARDHLIADVCGYALVSSHLTTGHVQGSDCHTTSNPQAPFETGVPNPSNTTVPSPSRTALPAAAIASRPTGVSLHFRLYEGNAPIPLGWALSSVARRVIDDQLNAATAAQPGSPQAPARENTPAGYNAALAATALAALRCYYKQESCEAPGAE